MRPGLSFKAHLSLPTRWMASPPPSASPASHDMTTHWRPRMLQAGGFPGWRLGYHPSPVVKPALPEKSPRRRLDAVQQAAVRWAAPVWAPAACSTCCQHWVLSRLVLNAFAGYLHGPQVALGLPGPPDLRPGLDSLGRQQHTQRLHTNQHRGGLASPHNWVGLSSSGTCP